MPSSHFRNRALAITFVGAFLAVFAAGEEIIVKNDSVVSFGQAVIVGDFVVGEQAGVRLTSPCNGTIVAIQILWLEGTPGHPASLEEAIYVFAGNTFPSPGAQLAVLEAPVLTPGYLNEFRYLDEAQMIPISIPVSQGQQFYITLKFANPTNVGQGGPSVVRDTDGCQSGKNVIYAIPPGTWFNSCSLGVNGDFAIRAVVNCPGATGACCYADGSCTNGVEQADCIAEYGATWHQGLTCSQITCTPRGACCVGTGCLQLVTPAQCAAIGGSYAGHGTNCNNNVCVAGACCFDDGDCELLFAHQCLSAGGTFRGAGTSCNPNPCPQPIGACCFGEICIPGQTESACVGATGFWAGAGTDCADHNGNSVPDACESGCPNPGGSGKYCSADIANGDCMVTIADLAALLGNYGMTSGATHAHGDIEPPGGDGDVDLADLAELLGQYGDNCN